MLKSGWSTLLRGDAAATKNELKSERISSDDGFFMIPTRKRSHVGNIYNMTTTGDLKVKKEKPPSPTSESDAGSMHVRFASATEDATSTSVETESEVSVSPPVQTPTRTTRRPMLRRMMTIDMTELTLEGIPFESSTYDLEMHIREILRDNPPLSPRLPDVNFDFSLEKTVLRR
eukprot:gene13990-4956_t